MLQAIGTKMYDGATPVRLMGVNDTIALAYCMAQISGTYPNYIYSNHNLPEYPVPGSSDSDRDCKILSDSYKEFWYKYFWLLKNRLGGAISCAPPYGLHPELSGTSALNHIRLGGHDSWGRSLQYKAFRDHRATVDQAMDEILDMALANGIYVNITMGGNPCNDSYVTTNFGAGNLFTPGNTAYLNFVQWCADYINAYGNHPAIACFDLFNEPDYNWFKGTYGYVIQPDGFEAWKSKMMEWKVALITDVKAKVTLNPRPLIAIAGGNSTIWWDTWDGHTLQDIENEKKETQAWWVADDIIIGHPYGGAEDDYIWNWNKQTEVFMNKPLYIEEWGYNQTQTGEPWVSYWPWYDLTFQKYDIDSCVMQLNGMPNPTPQPPGVPKLPYPGYPLDVTDLDAANAAWDVYNGAPPGPVGLPNKTVNLVITKGGTTVITASGVTNANGQVVFEYTPSTTGDYVANGNFAGDATYGPSSGSTNFSITSSTYDTAMAVTGSGSVNVNTVMPLTATLTRVSDGAALVGAIIHADITRPDNTHFTQDYTTDSTGKIAISFTPLTVGSYVFTASYAGDAQYEPSSATTSFSAISSLKQTRMVILAPATNPFTYKLGTSCPFVARLEYTNDGVTWTALNGKTVGLYRSSNTLPVINSQSGYNNPAGVVGYDIGSPPMSGYAVGDHRYWTWKFAGDATYAACNSAQQYLDVVA